MRLTYSTGPEFSSPIDGLSISIQLTVEQGTISQQFLIFNSSHADKEVQYALQAEGSTVTTLHVEGDRWEMNGDFDGSASKPQITRDANGFFVLEEDKTVLQHDDTTTRNVTRSEAVMAVFHNGVRISSENIISMPVKDENWARRGTAINNLPFNQKTRNVLCVPAQGIQELVVQYKLRPHHDHKLPRLDYLDVGTFLYGDQDKDWDCKNDKKIDKGFNAIFGRHLEHILCLCLIKNIPSSKSGPRVPFDTSLAAGSTPVGDL